MIPPELLINLEVRDNDAKRLREYIDRRTDEVLASITYEMLEQSSVDAERLVLARLIGLR